MLLLRLKYQTCLLYCFLYCLSSWNVSANDFDKALLWQVEHKNIQGRSYLFATMHSSHKKVQALLPKILPYIKQSDAVILETVPYNSDVLLAPDELDDDPYALLNLLGNDTFVTLYELLSQRGIDIETAMQLKPWAAVRYLSMSAEPEQGHPLDIEIYLRASLLEIFPQPLETHDEQLQVYYQMSPDLQLALLKETLVEAQQNDNNFDSMLNLYLQGDLQHLLHYSNIMSFEHAPATRLFMQRLIPQRNLRMFQRMQHYLRDGYAFIAVGALHFSGQQGLLNLLKQHDYTLTPIYLSPKLPLKHSKIP